MNDERLERGMTPKGAAFVKNMAAVDVLAASGLKAFVALAGGLEEDDWMLVYIAARKMAKDIMSELAAVPAQGSDANG